MPPLFDRFTRSRAPTGADAPAAATDAAAHDAVLDALPLGIAVLDADEKLVACNAALRRLLAIDDAMLRSQPDLATLVTWSRRGGSPEAGLHLTDGRPEAGPRRTERRLPGGIDVEVHAAAMPDGGVVLALQDVSAQRHAQGLARQSQGAVQKAEEEARMAIAARNQFAFNMAHELRTPMNAISGMLQAIEASNLDAAQRESLARAQTAARSLTAVMGNIIDFATMESGQVTLHPRPFELEDLLRDLADTFGATLGDKPLDFAFDIDPHLPARLVADDQRLRQVLLNLGGNAIKFTQEGTVLLRMAVLERTPASLTLEFSVSDSGVGIASDRLDAVLKGVGQVDTDTRRRFGGNGLGLGVCRQLLALMGSRLEARSTPGQGSSFSFRLQVGIDPDTSVAPVADARLRVLVADSRPETREARVRTARALGWQVQETATLAATYEALKQSRYLQLALVDWKLEGSQPFTAGLRCAQLLDGRHVPVLVLGPAAAASAYAALPGSSRHRLGGGLFGPASPGMLAHSARQAQGEQSTPRVQGLSGRALAGLRVLVAEDNENNQVVIRDLLQSQGASVEIAVDGLDTLTSLIANAHFDVILMDWQMPNMDGLEATREIRRIVGFESIPIVALTANATPQDRETCLAAGMDAHLGKPVDARELVATLLRHTRPGDAAAVAPKAGPLAPAAPAASRPAIDRAGAIGRLGGDAGLYDKVVKRFGAEAPGVLDSIRAALKSGARADARRHAHTLKSNAALLGAQALSDAAHAAEAQFSASETAGDDLRVRELAAAVESTLTALSAPA